MVILSACGSKERTENKIPQLSDHEIAEHEIVCSNSVMTVTDQGVLFPITTQSGDVLQYYDYHTGKTYPFCSNVSCSHSDDTCDAWFDSMVFGPVIYGDQIYLFSQNDDGDSWTLLSMDADGTNRRRITELKGTDFSCDYVMPTGSFWYQNGEVTFVVQCGSWEDGEDKQILSVVDLSSGQVKMLGTLGTNQSVLTYEQGMFLVSREEWDESILSMDEFYEKMGASADYDSYYRECYQNYQRTVYYLLDPVTGDDIDILTIPGDQDPAEWDYDHVADNGIYYGTAGNTIYGVDFKNRKLITVYQSDAPKTIECAADGKLLFLELDEKRENVTANSYLNLSTNKVTELNSQISGGGWICGFANGYFAGESQNGYFCIAGEDFYKSDFDRISIMKQ